MFARNIEKTHRHVSQFLSSTNSKDLWLLGWRTDGKKRPLKSILIWAANKNKCFSNVSTLPFLVAVVRDRSHCLIYAYVYTYSFFSSLTVQEFNGDAVKYCFELHNYTTLQLLWCQRSRGREVVFILSHVLEHPFTTLGSARLCLSIGVREY